LTSAVDYAAVWDYEAQPKEPAFVCNLCGPGIAEIEERPDRYGNCVCVARCAQCGLFYLGERMTAEAYRRFYETGAYRRLVSAYHGREINAQTIRPEQREYGRKLAALLEPWIAEGAETLLDVGGATGVVAHELARRFDLGIGIVDPAKREVLYANSVATYACQIEDFDPGDRKWDVVTLCQTVDHLLDPMLALRKIRSLLAPGGVFWVDALDYDRTRTLKIDHPFNFTEKTLRAMVEKAGFRIVQTSRDGDHVGFVCKGAE
jgi:2-polyprenyl-3-methyl-5-hydroxy-6-metoxy-1,4-benzoquinol methylase